MKFKNNWRQKSLEILENQNWGNPAKAPTNLIKRCIELTKIPLDNFTLSDLRIMIGQKIGLQFLIPIAIEKLKNDVFVSADFYEGDLLSSVLDIDELYWGDNEDQWIQLNDLIKIRREELPENKVSTVIFDNVKFKNKSKRS